MAKNQGLTPDDRVKLKTLDTLLESDIPRSHTIVAALIVQHWSDEHGVFQSQLVMRAERWRRQHIRSQNTNGVRARSSAIFGDLMRMIETSRRPMLNRLPQHQRRDTPSAITQPSLLPKAPNGMITDEGSRWFLGDARRGWDQRCIRSRQLHP